jgi:valyl-tRNA synthetase
MREGTESKLANAEFRAKAPQEVVEKLEQNLSQTMRQLEDIANKLKKIV